MSLQKLPEELLRIIATYLTGNSRDVINFSQCCQGAFWACQSLPGDDFTNIFHTKVLGAAFLYLQFVFLLIFQKDIGKIAANVGEINHR